MMKGKILQDHPARLSDLKKKIKSFTNKEKLKEFGTTKTSFTTNTQGTSLGGKARATTRKKNTTNDKAQQ